MNEVQRRHVEVMRDILQASIHADCKPNDITRDACFICDENQSRADVLTALLASNALLAEKVEILQRGLEMYADPKNSGWYYDSARGPIAARNALAGAEKLREEK